MTPEITLLQEQDLGPQFFLRPDHRFGISVESGDAGNLLATGSDGGAMLLATTIQGAQTTYNAAIVGRTIVLYATTNGKTTVVCTLDLSVVDMTVTGATITNGILSLTESNGGPTVQVDLSAFIKGVVTQGTPGVRWTGLGTAASPLQAEVNLDGTVAAVSGYGNLLKETAAGLKVDAADLLGFLNAATTVTVTVDGTNGLLKILVNGGLGTAGLSRAKAIDGTVIGYMLVANA